VTSSGPEPTPPPPPAIFEAATDAEATAQAVAAAAPVAPERTDISMLHTLDASLREPVYRFLSSLADNKYVLGRRYAEWCTGAPMLESAVAAAAMAQDELGHARSFYPLMRAFPLDRNAAAMEERGWQERPTYAMACLDRPFGAWVEYIAANVLVDTTLTTVLAAATDSTYEPLRQRARKILQEEAAHWVHGSGWLRRLATDPAMPGALESMWDDALTWLGPPDDSTMRTLVDSRILDADPDQLRDMLRQRLEPLFVETRLVAVARRELPWQRWDSAARKLTEKA
jgi:phenylacetate-CoA oxygenase PaaI subunit